MDGPARGNLSWMGRHEVIYLGDNLLFGLFDTTLPAEVYVQNSP